MDNNQKIALGISCYYHDSAVAVLVNGKIAAAIQEERFTRIKNDPNFPVNSIAWCLSEAGVSLADADQVVYYDNTALTLDRILVSHFITNSDTVFLKDSLIGVLTHKIRLEEELRTHFGRVGRPDRLYCTNHHFAHAASAFFPSPFEESAILTIDGVGEWATATIGFGNEDKIHLLKELRFPHSLGLVYSAFTHYCGFKVNSGEYKLMGLAPYGEPEYKALILDNLITVSDDGSFTCNLKYFSYHRENKLFNEEFEILFGQKRRLPEETITRHYADVATSIQAVLEEIVFRMAKHSFRITESQNLVMAGGVALNCVANGKLLKKGIFKNIWIQPAAGDAGGALGAAFAAYLYGGFSQKVPVSDSIDYQQGSRLGPQYNASDYEYVLQKYGLPYHHFEGGSHSIQKLTGWLNDGKIIGLFRGRSEFGPRALGNRSILANPLHLETQQIVNLKIKKRESFRPFAPIIMEECISEYYQDNIISPYMLFVSWLKEDKRIEQSKNGKFDIHQILNKKRSDIPAVTHVDYSSRIQSVNNEDDPYIYSLLKEFKELSGHGVLVNTSFNLRGEPIVESPEDAVRTFLCSETDILVFETCYVLRCECNIPSIPKLDFKKDEPGNSKTFEYEADNEWEGIFESVKELRKAIKVSSKNDFYKGGWKSDKSGHKDILNSPDSSQIKEHLKLSLKKHFNQEHHARLYQFLDELFFISKGKSVNIGELRISDFYYPIS